MPVRRPTRACTIGSALLCLLEATLELGDLGLPLRLALAFLPLERVQPFTRKVCKARLGALEQVGAIGCRGVVLACLLPPLLVVARVGREASGFLLLALLLCRDPFSLLQCRDSLLRVGNELSVRLLL